jgi:type I restriction enzyme, S subunit
MALAYSPKEIVESGEFPLLTKHESWKRVSLSDIASVQNGFAFSSENFTKKIGLPLIRIRDINRLDAENYYLGDYPSDFIVNPHDILIGMDGDFNIARWKGKRALLNQRVCRIIMTSKLYDVKFLFYVMPSFLNAINEKTSSVTVKHLSSKTINEIPLPLPPLAEQHRIVVKIEELFSSLDKGIESLKTAQEQLKIYRQAVLKWAFEGKLTNKNVKDGELPPAWKWKKTGEIIHTINNGYTPTKGFLSEGSGEVPFLKVYNLNFDGTLNSDKNPTFIPRSIHRKELKRSICYPGDVLINIVGPPLGKVSIVTNKYAEWNINQAIVMFRPNEQILSKYISYFLQNHVTIQWLENTSKATAGQWNVKVSTCREIPIPFCSVHEQQKVISEIERRISVCNKIQESITNSLLEAEALRQSILKKALEGKLVPQDLNDEPASVLLERIIAERELKQTSNKKKLIKNTVRKVKPVKTKKGKART